MTLEDVATYQRLRGEFEPLLISPTGCHLTSELCARGWDEDAPGGQSQFNRSEWFLLMIERSTEWLRGVNKTKQINLRNGTSYGYKHAVEAYWRCKLGGKGDTYIAQGAFLMAAVRMGFHLRPMPADYCGWGWDCHNAYMNVGQKRPKEERSDG